MNANASAILICVFWLVIMLSMVSCITDAKEKRKQEMWNDPGFRQHVKNFRNDPEFVAKRKEIDALYENRAAYDKEIEMISNRLHLTETKLTSQKRLSEHYKSEIKKYLKALEVEKEKNQKYAAAVTVDDDQCRFTKAAFQGLLDEYLGDRK